MTPRSPRRSENSGAPSIGASTTTRARAAWDIRRALAVDEAAVRRLLAESALPPDGLEDAFPEGYSVAESHGAVIGVAGVERAGTTALLRSVAVAASRRGERIGDALVRERLSWARGRSIARVHLLTQTASAWFERFGFRAVPRGTAPPEVRTSKQFASVCPTSAVLMALDL